MNGILNKKKEQRALLEKIKPYCPLSHTAIAIEADVSAALVGYVWAGVNANPKVLDVIINNLTQGWEDELTRDEVITIKSKFA